MTILALYSNKGGVGKTAAAVNLAYLAAQSGMKTLLCDLDPQSSATFYFRVQPKLKGGTKGFVKNVRALEQNIKATDYPNLDLLPADFALRDLATDLNKAKHPKGALRRALDPLRSQYALIILDSPPTISLFAENLLRAADLLLVPLIPTPLSLRSHEQLLLFAKEVAYDAGRVRAFFSMVDRRKRLHREQMAVAASQFRGLFETIIPYLSQVERMGVERQPLPAFAPRSDASIAYSNLWAEVVDRLSEPLTRGAVAPQSGV